MKARHILVPAIFLVALSTWSEPQASFDRYQIILDRKPFGAAPPPEPVVAPTVPPEQSFARTIRMSAIVEQDDGSIQVGFFDSSNNQSFFLTEGASENGIELVSADYENEEAILRKGSETILLKLASSELQSLTPQQQQERMGGGGDSAPTARRMSYAERRAAREKARHEAPPQPKYTGEELEQHLQEYQMEVIRQGLPPLPIPLTPEMDDQLVNEGVLPPVQ